MSFSVPCSGVGEFADFPVMCYNNEDRDWRMSVIKRVTDIVGSIVGLLITAVLFPFIAIAIKLEDPKGPVFFSQTRIGKNGRRFRIYKFRSMYADAEARKKELMAKNEVQGLMFKMENDPRITKVGKFLRRTSLDELPQFWNIFKGDMSLVGTRPPTVDEFEQYNDYYRRRMSITPGLTGLWQVSGRSEVKDFNEVVKLDLQYIDNWSIGQDLKILIQTVGVVLLGKGSK
jgi:exopolysaccharide biosynthesis polyprenyl glycosylphosphotransferase